MGLQLVICVEASKQSKTDYIYIKNAIEYFYNIDYANIKLSPVYMNGRGNYNSRKVEKNVADQVKQYSATSEKNSSIVLYCFDCDHYDSNPEDRQFLQEVDVYCRNKGFMFVWFCRDIEEVFTGSSVPNTLKNKTANSFKRNKQIQSVEINRLRSKQYRATGSNLCSVLDELRILKKKEKFATKCS